jgi:hypothetical protein
VEQLLAGAETAMTYDTFELAASSDGHALSTLAYYLMQRTGLVSEFNLDPTLLARWLRNIECGYLAGNPYHNATHAADVLQTLHVTLHSAGLVPHYAGGHTLLACYLAAVVHDYEHLGVTNDFLVNTDSELAIRYNDRAPMENHHLAAAFISMRKHNFMVSIPKATYDNIRKVRLCE